MENLLLEAEQRILAYHGEQIRHWVEEQRFALQQSAALDSEALAAQAELCGGCLEAVREDLEVQREDKREVDRASASSVAACEQSFREELGALGDAYAAEAAEVLAQAKARVQRSHDACEGREWDHLDHALRAVMLKHARAHHGFGVVDGVAELWERGEFQPHLEGELEGWAASQRSDVARLHADIEAECGGALQALQRRLKDLSPEAILGRPSMDQLATMVDTEARRLKATEAMLCAGFRAEIDEVIAQCEQNYRRYDCELQRILVRTLEVRARNAACMRQYRLALCRWRLDYQRAFHMLRDDMESVECPTQESRQSLGSRRGRRRQGQKQLESLRRLARGLWARSRPPVREVSRFLGAAASAAARAGLADPLLRVFEEELRRHGALPLLEHAARPELLECWLQALQSP